MKSAEFEIQSPPFSHGSASQKSGKPEVSGKTFASSFGTKIDQSDGGLKWESDLSLISSDGCRRRNWRFTRISLNGEKLKIKNN